MISIKYLMDYDFVKKQRTGVVSAAGMYPLFFGMATPEQAKSCAKVLERELLKPGGIVTTANATGQQWDAPNGWAPLQWISIQGLRKYDENELAQTIRQRWTHLNVKVYKNTGKMVEKYNVLDMTLQAGGGEDGDVRGWRGQGAHQQGEHAEQVHGHLNPWGAPSAYSSKYPSQVSAEVLMPTL